MGIKVSYKGSTGRKIDMDFDGSEESLARLQQFASANAVKSRGDDANIPLKMPQDDKPGNRREQGLVSLTGTDQPGFLKQKLAREASLEVSDTGMRLKGDSSSLSSDKTLFYTRDKGRPAWKEFGEVDSGGNGVHVGAGAGDLSLEANSDKMDEKDGHPTTRTWISRIAVKVEAAGIDAQLVIYGFYVKQTRSRQGRIVTESPESRAVIASVNIGKLVAAALTSGVGGGGSGKYCVRPVVEDGVLKRLEFGSDSELGSNKPSLSVETSVCPNVELAEEDDARLATE